MITEATALDPTQYALQYELLRSQVIAATRAPAQPSGVGLALLLREGMPGWLKAVETVIHASVALRARDAAQLPASEPPGRYGSAPAWLSSVPHHDLTTLLTSLVLSTRRHERSSPRKGYRSCQ